MIGYSLVDSDHKPPGAVICVPLRRKMIAENSPTAVCRMVSSSRPNVFPPPAAPP
jgi:hypothetical protein